MLLSASGCGSTSPAPAPAPADPGRAPAWTHQALTWSKLDSIEAWLDGPDARGNPALRVEAEIELAEGRLHFAREEAGTAHETVQDVRLAKARSGFQRVVDDPFASSLQRRRARSGLRDVEGFSAPSREPAAARPDSRLIPRSEWGATAAIPGRLKRNDGPWRKITIHHSGPPDQGMSASTGEARTVMQRIQKHHTKNNGWGDIGYHFLIDPAGRLYEGRSLRWQGAHAGYDERRRNNNPHNIGICVLGNYAGHDRPSAAVLGTLRAVVDDLRRVHGIDRNALYSHKRLAASVCPGPDLDRWVEDYRRGVTTQRVGSAPATAIGAGVAAGVR